MFSYIDPGVRERLLADGTLFRIDSEGVRLPVDAATGSGQTISILGPIPLPLDVGERRIDVIELAEFCRLYGISLGSFLVSAGLD